MKENLSIIELKVKNKTELYSKFSTDNNKVVNEEVVSYIENLARKLPNKENLQIKIESEAKLIKAEQDDFKEAFRKYYKNKNAEINKNTNFFYLLSFVFLLVGMACIVGLNFLRNSNVSYVAQTILEVVSWVFIWEFVDILCFKIGINFFKRRKNNKFLKSEIVFRWKRTQRF